MNLHYSARYFGSPNLHHLLIYIICCRYIFKKFREYILTSNLVQRLEARYEIIGDALGAAYVIRNGSDARSDELSSQRSSCNDAMDVNNDLYQCFLKR